ncbi:MAG TPA: cytochrome P450 [Nocardioidaceae bacterium]|nr:cytochrome P450 [Nocardioidaceae bacterium]
MRQLPLLLWKDGYRATARLRERAGGSDVFSARLLNHPAWVVRGRPQVERFYDEAFIRREGALPSPLANLLFGKGAVHGKDGAEHRHRKGLFLDVLDDAAVLAVTDRAEKCLRTAWDARHSFEPFDPFDVLVDAYGAAALDWAGIALEDDDVLRVSRDLAAIVDGFGAQGIAGVRAALARRRCNAWATGLIRTARAEATVGSVLGRVAHHRGSDGELLPAEVAGVELLNVLRPTVAVAFLGAFAALYLERSREWRVRLERDSEREAIAFAQEVRRHAPFVPALLGRAARDADWGGCPVRKDDLVLLDVWAVNHDERRWHHASAFDPDRFLTDDPDEFDMVPQGGGDRGLTHRCPGEPLTIALLAQTARFLASNAWSAFDGTYDETRIPARPAIRLVKS